jgi:EmrB/QacA subfamily drug resistance transporter
LRTSDSLDAPSLPGSTPAAIDIQTLRIAAVVVLGSFMSILDTTIVNVAIRALAHDFASPLETTQWVATGYTLALAAVIPLTGWAADRFGTKRLYITSITLFLLGSALSGSAWSMSTLILFRVLQGLGGGMIMPAGMTILSHAAGPQRIGRLMGIVGIPMLLGPILGPILGGWLVDDASWRWIFFVNLPVGAVALLGAFLVLAPDEPRPAHRLDALGLLLLSPGLAIFVFALARTTAHGNLLDPADDAGLVLGVALIAAFIVHARRTPGALIDVRLFARRPVAASALTTFLFGVAFFGWAILLPLYFQLVRHASAFQAGMMIAPQGFGAMISMPIASRMTDRTGAGRIVMTGLVLIALAMLIMAQVTATTPVWQTSIALFLSGLGMGATIMPATSAAMITLARHEIARATSGLNVVQRVGGSIGTALLAVILNHRIAALAPDARIGGSAPVPGYLLDPLAHAFGQTFLCAFVVILAALLAATYLPRRRASLSADAREAAETVRESAS